MYYILDFWFLGCAPCRREHKDIQSKLIKLTNKNIAVIGIDIFNDDYETWRTYLSKNKYTWQNYMETKSNGLADYLAISIFPNYVIINRDGEIIGSYDSFSSISIKYGLN